MMRPQRTLPLLIAGLLAAAACTGGDGDAPEAGPTDPPPDGQREAPPLIDAPGLGEVTLTTATEGAGERPELAWEAVDGASWYTLTVYAEDGAPYWAWEGESTSVPFGGDQVPAENDGPRLTAGMSWSVVAWDGDDQPVAVSPVRPIAP